MGLDHGIINVPLSKRGNIDAQLDSHKAQQAAERRAQAKAAAAETKALRARAKALVDAADPAVLAAAAARSGSTVAAVKAMLRSDAHWNQARVIRTLGGAA
jgi:predicted DsbA family dithiol-disulfide isomerase